MDLIDAFRLGWREAEKHHQTVNMFEPVEHSSRITQPTDDEIRQLLGLEPPPRANRPAEPHELSELPIG